MYKKVLITGGFGFLGGRIVHSLLTTGKYNVTIGSRGNKENLPKQLIGCDVVSMNLLKRDNISKYLKDIDFVIHLAAMNANQCKERPDSALSINALGTFNLVELAEMSGVKKFIYFSTAHVYGSSLFGSISEDSLTRPSSHYAITHKTAEDYVMKIGKKGLINTTILRLSNTVGHPLNQDANCWMLAANDMAKQIIEKNSIHINLLEDQLRDFVPISNVISAVMFFLENSNSCNEILNLGSGKTLSILGLAKLLSKRAKLILGIDVQIVSTAKILSNNQQFNYKINKILSLGYSPVCSLEEDIDSLLIYANKEFKRIEC